LYGLNFWGEEKDYRWQLKWGMYDLFGKRRRLGDGLKHHWGTVFMLDLRLAAYEEASFKRYIYTDLQHGSLCFQDFHIQAMKSIVSGGSI
jgi:hypothetical protein